MTGLLDGKVAVITGAGSGMARATSRIFVREGAQVLAADISGGERDTAAELGDAVVPFRVDVTQEADVEAMMAAAIDAFGRIDAVLNVAGIGDGGLLADVTMEQYDRIMDVDLRGVVLGTKHGIRSMLPTGGGVVLNWSSIGGFNADPGVAIYSAAKAGVIAVTKNAAIEYGTSGIRANAICPGFILTEMSAPAVERSPERLTRAALGRGGEPEEVGEVAAFLASDRASFVSGAVIAVDGGWSSRLY